MIEKTICHLGFIQGIIGRMATNSFLLKGWSVTLIGAIFALSSKESEQRFLIIPPITIFVFWLLDGYYVRQEKLYRELYDEVAGGNISSDVFTLDTLVVSHRVPSMLRIAFSRSVIWFHFTIFIALIVISTIQLKFFDGFMMMPPK